MEAKQLIIFLAAVLGVHSTIGVPAFAMIGDWSFAGILLVFALASIPCIIASWRMISPKDRLLEEVKG